MLFEQDIHLHSKHSDGMRSIFEMVRTCVSLGKREIAVTDHACGWGKIVFFESLSDYKSYLEEINILKEALSNQKTLLLSGLEVEVNIDGAMRLDKSLSEYSRGVSTKKQLGIDILLGSIHSESFEEDVEKYGNLELSERRDLLMKNVISLIEHPEIDVFCHPSQAIHGQFSDNLRTNEIRAIVETFLEQHKHGHKIFLELNGKINPTYEQWNYDKYKSHELNLYDINLYRSYLDAGLKIVMGSDAHSAEEIIDVGRDVITVLEITPDNIHRFA